MHHLIDVVERWYELGVQLDVPISKLNEIRCNNSSDVYQCKLLMLQEWQRRPTLNPSWFTLVDALRKMEENVIANKIAEQFSELYTHNCCRQSRLYTCLLTHLLMQMLMYIFSCMGISMKLRYLHLRPPIITYAHLLLQMLTFRESCLTPVLLAVSLMMTHSSSWLISLVTSGLQLPHYFPSPLLR